MHHMQRLIEIPNALRQVIEPLRLAPSTFYPTLAYCADCRRFSRGADFKGPLPINASSMNAAWLIAFSTGATFAGLGLSESISISFRAESSVAAKKDGVLTLFCHWKPRNRNRGRGGTLIVQLVPDLRNVFEHWCIPDPGAALGAEVPNREAVQLRWARHGGY